MSELNPLTSRDISPWTTRQKVARICWAMVQASFFRISFHNWYPWRAWLLRQFGARVGNGCRIRRTVKIEIPWNLQLGDQVIIGDGAILYALGKMTIGNRCMISQYAHLCGGSHDSRFRTYPLIKSPITIGEDCWIAADAFIGPGVTVGPRSVVSARACVFKDIPPDVIVRGNPAEIIKARVLEDVKAGAPVFSEKVPTA
jgi:putative colanic acid biosynthesis acetyltransferase WcaF